MQCSLNIKVIKARNNPKFIAGEDQVEAGGRPLTDEGRIGGGEGEIGSEGQRGTVEWGYGNDWLGTVGGGYGSD